MAFPMCPLRKDEVRSMIGSQVAVTVATGYDLKGPQSKHSLFGQFHCSQSLPIVSPPRENRHRPRANTLCRPFLLQHLLGWEGGCLLQLWFFTSKSQLDRCAHCRCYAMFTKFTKLEMVSPSQNPTLTHVQHVSN